MTHLTSFSTLKPMSIGFDDFFKYIESAIDRTQQDKFPPFNIIKTDDYNFIIEVALAGYAKEDIEISTHDSLLEISSSKQKSEDERQFLHRGISSRAFTTTFPLGENIIVKEASFVNGILSVNLERIVPEEKKPKTITIS